MSKKLTDYQRGVIAGWIAEAKCQRMERAHSLKSTLSMTEAYEAADVRGLYDTHWPVPDSEVTRG